MKCHGLARGYLRREGLVKRQETQLTAAKEYHTKTTRPHQMWATDASYFRVVGWGYYYLVTVMDDYSRFILAWKLQKDMSANSLIEVIQEAVDATGMTEVPIEDRTKLLSDNGAGYVSKAFRDYFHLMGIGHIRAAPFHPQTNGKDWLELWRELVIATSHSKNGELVSRYETHTRKRDERPDPLLDFVLRNIDSQTTILDVGAGSGRWTIPLAKIARTVTAVEPSDAMRNALRQNLVFARVNNVEIIQSSWEEAIVQTHDVIVCVHTMYASPDLGSFVRKMEQ